MPGSVAGLLSCWHQWLGKHNSDIWNLVPGCLIWIVWLERNRWSFEDKEKMLDELKLLCHHSLLEWSRCWGFTDCSSLSKFLSSLSLVSYLPSVCCVVCSFFSSCSSSRTSCIPLFSIIYKSSLITYQKKKLCLKSIRKELGHPCMITYIVYFFAECERDLIILFAIWSAFVDQLMVNTRTHNIHILASYYFI